MGISENRGYLRVPLKGYYKGTIRFIRVPLKGSTRAYRVSENKGHLNFGVLIIRILLSRAPRLGSSIFGSSHITTFLNPGTSLLGSLDP